MSEVLECISAEPFKRLLKESGYFSKYVADKVGIPDNVMRQFTSGCVMFKTDRICKLASFFEVPVSQIIEFKGIEYKDLYKDRWDRASFVPPKNALGIPSYQPMRDLVESFIWAEKTRKL